MSPRAATERDDASRAERRETPNALVSGDRLCTGCGYNLVGQTIVREPHYNLLIARCPECGTVAALQEYPLLGRWAARWGVILSALWFVLLLGLWPASSGSILAWTLGAAEQGSWPMQEQVDQAVQEHVQAQAAGGSGALRVSGLYGSAFAHWWEQQDHAALFRAAGGWRGAIAWDRAAWFAPPLAINAFVVGWIWSIALLHLRRRWLFLATVAILGLTALFALLGMSEWLSSRPGSSWDAARGIVGPAVVFGSIAFAAIPLVAGLLLGRPLTRLAARALLAPRARGSLAALWTADGKHPPSRKKGSGVFS